MDFEHRLKTLSSLVMAQNFELLPFPIKLNQKSFSMLSNSTGLAFDANVPRIAVSCVPAKPTLPIFFIHTITSCRVSCFWYSLLVFGSDVRIHRSEDNKGTAISLLLTISEPAMYAVPLYYLIYSRFRRFIQSSTSLGTYSTAKLLPGSTLLISRSTLLTFGAYTLWIDVLFGAPSLIIYNLLLPSSCNVPAFPLRALSKFFVNTLPRWSIPIQFSGASLGLWMLTHHKKLGYPTIPMRRWCEVINMSMIEQDVLRLILVLIIGASWFWNQELLSGSSSS